MFACTLSACTTVYEDHGAVQPDPWHSEPAEYFFVGNASKVDFDDLLLVNAERPAFQGLFDRAYKTHDLRTILGPEVELKKRPFTPEAEWLMLFERALPQSRNDLPPIQNIRVRFQGMIEGKWLDVLQDHGPRRGNRWVPASAANNFYDPEVAEEDLPDGYKELRKWDELISSHAQLVESGISDCSVGVSFQPRVGGTTTYVSTFDQMVRGLFREPNAFTPSRLVEEVCEIYYNTNKVPSSVRRAIQLRGINLGAHGPEAAFVNTEEYKERAVRHTLLTWLLPRNIFETWRPSVRGKRRMGWIGESERLDAGSVGSIKLWNVRDTSGREGKASR